MNRRRFLPLLLAGLDFVCVIVVFHIIAWLRGTQALGPLNNPALVVPFVVLVLAVHLIDGYSARTDMLSLAYTSQHSIALAAAGLAMFLVTFVFIRDQSSLHSSRTVIALSFIALIPVTLSYRRWLALRTAATGQQRAIVFVGSQASCVVFKETCEKNHLHQAVVYVATDAASHESISPWVGVEMHAVSQLF